MENSCQIVVPHSRYLEILFAYKGKVSSVFKEVLGIHEIHHLALTRINHHNELITLSSTPAMEFNLFSSPLWQFDRTYSTDWFRLCTQATWQSLYDASRYDELYYLKQIKHNYPLGVSLAAKIDQDFFIFSIASHKGCPETQALFTEKQDELYQIGQYCSTQLKPLLTFYDEMALPSLLKTG